MHDGGGDDIDDRPPPEVGGLRRHARVWIGEPRHDCAEFCHRLRADTRVRAIAIFAAPVGGIAHPALAAESAGYVGQVEPKCRIRRSAVESSVMVDPGRNHQNIPRVHVVRPVRDAAFRAEQHADDELRIGRRPLRSQSNRERSDAEGEVSDADMGQQATEPASLKLHHIDMRAVNGVAKTFETIDARRDDRQAVHRQSPLIRCRIIAERV